MGMAGFISMKLALATAGGFEMSLIDSLGRT